MKLRFIYSIFTLLLAILIFNANSAGRAGGTNQGNTGAPGDETLGNGPRTCQSCHATSDIQVTMDLEILDNANTPITEYTPNEMYTARVSINHVTGPMPEGYGFQLLSLLDKDSSDVNGWTMDGHSANVQIAKASNTNRVYAEHKGTSDNNVFLVQWQAPQVGSGIVSFYAAGNGVNKNGSTSGDGSTAPTKISISEGQVSSIKELTSIGINVNVLSNPIKNQLHLNFNSQQSKKINIKILNAVGQLFHNTSKLLPAGNSVEMIETDFLANGLYWVQIVSEGALSTQKIIKI